MENFLLIMCVNWILMILSIMHTLSSCQCDIVCVMLLYNVLKLLFYVCVVYEFQHYEC